MTLDQRSHINLACDLGANTPEVKKLIGKAIAEIARGRGVSPENAIIDLAIEDEGGAAAAYTIISEAILPNRSHCRG